jgi:polyisoprenoid-binding protein YceI
MALETWNYDPVHSDIGFSVRHLMISKVRGHFKKWSGTLAVDESNLPASKVSVEIDAASLDTNEEQRDNHLRSADFLDVANYPAIQFESTGVQKTGDSELKVTGNLTIRGVTKPVVLDVEYLGRTKDPWGGERAGFTAQTAIDRKDYGLTWNMALEAGGIMVGDKVEINLEIEAVKAQGSGAGQ